MEYVKTGTKTSNIPAITAKQYYKAAKHVSTPELLFLLVVRHKMFFLVTGNILLVMNWAIPMWPSMVAGLLSSLF